MQKFMTFFTKRNNIKPMFWFITKIMMIFLGLCATFYTFETSGLFCFMIFSLVIYYFFFVQSVVFGVIFFAFFFAFWCFVKFCLKHYSTFFAITRKTIISRFVFVKFQNWLNFFTFRTLFFIHKNNNNIRVGICQ